MFPILVAADIFGTKLNYELDFSSVPSLAELQHRVDAVFSTEFNLRRPPGIPASRFTIHRLQVFDERNEVWVDLLSPSQLLESCQIYAFQPETSWHKEVQSKLPPASKPFPVISSPKYPPHRSPHASPVRIRSPHHYPSTPPHTVSAAHHAPISLTAERFEDKVRAVFVELDVRKIGAVSLDDFVNTLARLRVDFTQATVTDLFQKADADRDTVVSFPEFERFAERYPTLLDAMYCRSREFVLHLRQQEGIDAANRLLESLRAREADARMMAIQATSDTHSQDLRLQAARGCLAEAEAKEREQAAILTAAQADCDHLRGEVAARANDLTMSKEMVQAREQAHLESIREIDHKEALLRGQEADLSQVEAKIAELEAQLQVHLAEANRQKAMVLNRAADLKDAHAAEQAALAAKGAAEREAAVAADMLTKAEQHLIYAQERERECVAHHMACKDDMARRMAQCDAEEQELRCLREREAQKKVMEAEAAKAVEAQDRMTRALEAECIDHDMTRRRVEEEERPLLEQEVRLREQRDCLEMQEAKLRVEHDAFHTRTQKRGIVAASPRSSLLPSPPSHPLDARQSLSPTAPAAYLSPTSRYYSDALSPRHRNPSVSPKRIR